MSARRNDFQQAQDEVAYCTRAVRSHYELVASLRLILAACRGFEGPATTLDYVETHARLALEQVDRHAADWIRDYIAATHARVNRIPAAAALEDADARR